MQRVRRLAFLRMVPAQEVVGVSVSVQSTAHVVVRNIFCNLAPERMAQGNGGQMCFSPVSCSLEAARWVNPTHPSRMSVEAMMRKALAVSLRPPNTRPTVRNSTLRPSLLVTKMANRKMPVMESEMTFSSACGGMMCGCEHAHCYIMPPGQRHTVEWRLHTLVVMQRLGFSGGKPRKRSMHANM